MASRTAWRMQWLYGAACCAALAAGCGDVNAALQELAEARQLAADMHVQFTTAADASNRAVMSDTDAASIASAREAEQAKQRVKQDADALGPMLVNLHYTDESRVLQEFLGRFAEYETLDKTILGLAVENTNLKAQQLSFGPAQESSDAFRDAIDAVAASVPADTSRARALAATAIAAVRDIQVLQAPHIAEPQDAVMARLETRMTSSATVARGALQTLGTMAPSGSRSKVAAATAAFDQFMDLNAQVLALSHRNTNVHSLALSLSEKPVVTAACEDRLRALQDALAKRAPKVARFKQGS